MRNDHIFLKKVAAAVSAVAILLGIVGYETVRVTTEQKENLDLVSHTYDLRETIYKIVEGIGTAGAAQRAYVVRGAAEDLETFENARVELNRQIAKLSDLVSNDPKKLERARTLIVHIEHRVTYINDLMTTRRSRAITANEQQAASIQAVTQLERIIHTADELSQEEDRLLAIRLEAATMSRQRTQILVLSGLSLSFFLVFLSGSMTFRNLRHRLAVETRLRDNAALLEKTLNLQRTMVDSAGYAIIATDVSGIVTHFNPAAESLLGYRAHKVIGRMSIAQFHDKGEIVARAEAVAEDSLSPAPTAFEIITALARKGEIDDREWHYVCENNTKIPVQLSVAAIHSADSGISGYLIIAGNISERKKVDRLKGEFISTVSHELRTPLTSIRGSLGLVLGGVMGELPAQAKGLLVIANKNVDRLSLLINDILDVEKIESGKMDFNIRWQPLTPLIEQAMEGILDYGRQFDVSFVLKNQAPDSQAAVDSDRFLQIMANLMSNAAKFSMPGDTVDVVLAVNGPMVRISVIDRGKGIPLEFRDRVFEKFAQADGSDTKHKSGTGLGLSITKSMVERMHGAIAFETEEGKGTAFHVDFPRENAVLLPSLPPHKTARLNGRPTVLICEADAEAASLMRTMLEQGGYNSEVVGTAAEAKERLRTRNYAALSLSMAPPDQTGPDLFRELRNDPATRRLPVAVVSPQTEEGRLSLNGQPFSVADWLAKPVDRDRLIGAIQDCLRGQTRKARLLHIADDIDTIREIAGMVERTATVERAVNAAQAASLLASAAYDLVLLDLGFAGSQRDELLRLLDGTPLVILASHDAPEVLTSRLSNALLRSRTTNDHLLDSVGVIPKSDRLPPPS